MLLAFRHLYFYPIFISEIFWPSYCSLAKRRKYIFYLFILTRVAPHARFSSFDTWSERRSRSLLRERSHERCERMPFLRVRWSYSSAGTGCAYSHGGEVFILRKRDIDRNRGRVVRSTRFMGTCSPTVHVQRVCMRTRGSPARVRRQIFVVPRFAPLQMRIWRLSPACHQHRVREIRNDSFQTNAVFACNFRSSCLCRGWKSMKREWDRPQLAIEELPCRFRRASVSEVKDIDRNGGHVLW